MNSESQTFSQNPAVRRKEFLRLNPENCNNFYELVREILKTEESPVLRHEIAFILGTVKTEKSLEILKDIVTNDESDLVRHEAIEAIGDLGIENDLSTNLLIELSEDPNPFIKDTARIALATIKI